MKKLVIIALAFVAMQATAQEKKQALKKGERVERTQRMENSTPEVMADKQTKKMTEALGLNESQQKQVHALNLENAKERKAFMDMRKEKMADKKAEKPSKEERMEMKKKMTGHLEATKNKMKEILNEEQYAKWEKQQERREAKTKERMSHRNGERKHMKKEK